MDRQVTSEEFFEKIGPLNVTLDVRGRHPFKTLFKLKYSGKIVGYEEHERFYLCEEEAENG